MLDDFFVRALLAGIGLAFVTGPTGCFVVWRRLAYFGEAIAHSSLLGVALAIVLHLDLVIGILISAALVASIMFYLDRLGAPIKEARRPQRWEESRARTVCSGNSVGGTSASVAKDRLADPVASRLVYEGGLAGSGSAPHHPGNG